jgi:hypothetical protein
MKSKKIRVWMDHSIAYLIQLQTVLFEIQTIESEFIEDKRTALVKKHRIIN